MTAIEALNRYRKRDSSENIFFFDKTGLGNKCNRTHSDRAAKAMNFVEFIAIILRHEIYTSLLKNKQEKGLKFNYLNIPGAVKELDSIKLELWKNKQYNLSKALTRTHKNILTAFNIEDDAVQEAVTAFNERVFKKD